MHSALIYIKRAGGAPASNRNIYVKEYEPHITSIYVSSTHMYVYLFYLYMYVYRKLLKPDVRYVHTIYALGKLFFISVRAEDIKYVLLMCILHNSIIYSSIHLVTIIIMLKGYVVYSGIVKFKCNQRTSNKTTKTLIPFEN